MKRILVIVAASLFFNLAAAKTVQNYLDDDLVLIFDEGRSHGLDREGVYNYSSEIRTRSIGLIRSTKITPSISIGGIFIGWNRD